MPTTVKDPRTYVRQIGLPIPPQNGVKIQARSSDMYNPTEPTRTDVRDSNYRRRLAQLTQQGFRSVNHKPYQGIGDPFYLDQKKLILHALGQLEDGQELDTSSSCDSSDEEEMLQQKTTQGHMTTANFMLRKARKGLNTLTKEMGHGRDLIRNVRLGHGLFQLLQKENEQRTEAKQKELQKKREQMWNEWQPPKSDADTDSDLTDDDELNQDVDLKEFNQQGYMICASSVFDPGDDKTEKIAPSPPPAAQTSTFLTQGLETKPMTESRSVVFRDVHSTHTAHITDMAKSIASVNPSSGRSMSKKKVGQTRPFTPQHSNISAEYNMIPDKQALFRQLCALFWLLEAMNTGEQNYMSPITTCWNLRDMGGYKTPPTVKQQKEKTDYRWKQFKSNTPMFRPEDRRFKIKRRNATMTPQNTGIPILELPTSAANSENTIVTTETTDEDKNISDALLLTNKRYSGPRASIQSSSLRRSSTYRRGSVSSTPTGSQSQLNLSGSGSVQGVATPGVAGAQRRDHAVIPEDGESPATGTVEQEEDDGKDKRLGEDPTNASKPDSHDGEKRPSVAASEVPGSILEGASTRSESSIQQKRHLVRKTTVSDDLGRAAMRPRASSSPKRGRTSVDIVSKELQAQILESINRSEEDPRLHRLANPTEKRSSSGLRAEYNVRPKSSEAVIKYQATLPSTRIGTLPNKLRREFDEVTEEKALVLHDTLEAIDRERMRKLRTMFTHVPTRSSLHKALEKMRTKGISDEDQKDKRRRSSTHQQWYIDLCSSIPTDMRNDWYCGKIMDKLSKYGLVEASKQSAYKFLRVLAGLRDWELCSPDICAAVEFCREKIVEMTVDEYEEWFTQTFPTIARPQTAPPAVKGSKRDGGQKALEGHRDQKNLVPKSAPPGTRVSVQ